MSAAAGTRTRATCAAWAAVLLLARLARPTEAADAAGAAQAADAATAIPTMLVELHLPRVTRQTIETPIVAGDQPGIPVFYTARLLEIFVEQTEDGHLAGYLGDPERRFHLEPRARRGESAGQAFSLGPGEVLAWQGDVYLSPKAAGRLFGIRLYYSAPELRVTLATDPSIPVYARAARRASRERAATAPGPDRTIDPPPRLLDGATLDWTLDLPDLARETFYRDATYRLGIGLELLGGEGTLYTAGRFEAPPFEDEPIWSWFWRPRGWRWLREAGGGRVATVGFRPQRIRGARLGNIPRYRDAAFGTLRIDEPLPPGADVEVYVDGLLQDFGRVDERGRFRTDLPIHYGAPEVRLDVFRPTGQLERKSYTVVVPNALLPAGQVEWGATFGEAEDPRWRWFGDADLRIGAWDGLTVRAGSAFGQPVGQRWRALPYAAPTLRLWDGLILAAAYMRDVSWEAEASYRLGSFRARCRYEAPFADPLWNPERVRDRWESGLFYATDALGVVVGVDAGYSRTRVAEEVREVYRAATTVSFGVLQVRTELDHRSPSTGRAAWEARVGLSGSIPLPGLPYYAAPYVRGEVGFDPTRGDPLDATVIAQQSLFDRLLWIDATWTRDLKRHTDAFSAAVSVRFDWGYARTQAAGGTGAGWRLGERLEGSLLLDLGSGSVTPSPWAGGSQGYVRGRVFARGLGDGPDRPIAGVVVRAGQARAVTDADGVYVVPGLLLYQTVTVSIDEGTLPDPALVPEAERVAAPVLAGRSVRVDFPLLPTGEVSGGVFAGRGPSRRPLPGLTVELTPAAGGVARQGRTYSDGGFYFDRVPPGRYRLRLVAAEVERRGLRPAPSRALVVGAKEYGDQVGPIELELEERR